MYAIFLLLKHSLGENVLSSFFVLLYDKDFGHILLITKFAYQPLLFLLIVFLLERVALWSVLLFCGIPSLALTNI